MEKRKRSLRRGVVLPTLLMVAMGGMLAQVNSGCISEDDVEHITRTLLDESDIQDELQGEAGAPGAPGTPGADGLPGEDGAAGADGDDGQDGDDGEKGDKGDSGDDGTDGLACWDLNENGVADIATEDINGDGVVNIYDCHAEGLDCAGCDDRFVDEGQVDAVSTDMIQDGAVTAAKIGSESQAQGKVLKSDGGGGVSWEDDLTDGNGGLGCEDCDERFVNEGQADSVDEGMIVNEAVGWSELAPNSVDSSKVVDASLTASDLAANAVDTSEIANGAVTGAKIAQMDAAEGEVLTWNATSTLWEPRIVPGGGDCPWQVDASTICYTGGDVGIGTCQPDEKLHVVGSARVTSSLTAQAVYAENTMESADDIVAGGDIEAGNDVLAGDDVEADGDVIARNKLWSYGDADIDGNMCIGTSVSSLRRLYVVGGSDQVALWAQGSWLAGHFQGDVNVTGDLNIGGELSKASGTFKIDHPLDPANKYLYHSFVESPDMLNIYNGNATTDAEGQASVYLPEWFEALNKDFRYQLTVIGQFAQAIVAAEIQGNKFSIQTDKPFVKVSWQVTGVRHDRYAEAYRIQVEEEKAPSERGTFLHPELYAETCP